MSVRRNTIRYGVAAAALAILIIAGATYFVGNPSISSMSSTPSSASNSATSSAMSSAQTSAQGASSVLVIQLTDPPQVPVGTTSLNLTYSALTVLVGEPTGTDNQMTTKSITITPPGGTATLDLLRLQNVSQTIGSTNLPDGSVVYSVTFSVTKIGIDVSGTVSPVTLATGSTFTVAVSNPGALHGTNLALLRLDPVVVDTPSGYSLIPSSVGAICPSEGTGEGNFGFLHHLTSNDNWYLNFARGSSKANLAALSVSGTTTTIKVQVNNTGTTPMSLDAIGIQGNFSVNVPVNGACPAQQPTIFTNTHTMEGYGWCGRWAHQLEVVFVPVIPASTSTTTSNSCLSLSMQLVNTLFRDYHVGALTLAPGECVNLTFSGQISFMGSALVLVPSTLSGQHYQLHIISFSGGNLRLECTLPLGVGSCKPDTVQW